MTTAPTRARPTVHIVSCGIGNVRSAFNAFERAGAEPVVAETPAALAGAEKIVLPGVGAFGACAQRLRDSGFVPALDDFVRGARKPFLGICVGMQLLAEEGLEFGRHAGLGYVPGRCEVIPQPTPAIRLPHVGWNALELLGDCPLFTGLGGDRSVYFVHSFHLVAADPAHVAARVDYGTPITAAIWNGNVFGVQFHPEKSQAAGLSILRAFASL